MSTGTIVNSQTGVDYSYRSEAAGEGADYNVDEPSEIENAFIAFDSVTYYASRWLYGLARVAWAVVACVSALCALILLALATAKAVVALAGL